jgi:hypothetical protein
MKSNDCNNAKKGVVVFLDALGTRNLDLEQSKKFCILKEKFIEDAKELWKKRQGQFIEDTDIEWNLPEPEISTFQDSIVICWSDQQQKKDSLNILFSAGQWLIDAIPLAIGQYNLFFRGTISYGEFIFTTSPDNVTVIGPAVTDAYNYHDLADWIGIIQTPNCQKQYISLLKSIAEKKHHTLITEIDYFHFLFTLYDVPLHARNEFNTPTMEFFSISWPQISIMIEHTISIAQILLDKCISENPKYKSKYCNGYVFQKWYRETGKYISPQG